ncbi:MAG: DMT family transporter [Alphaproteobacteria bacterium]
MRPLTYVQLFTGMALFGSATPLSKIIAGAFPVFSASLLRMGIAVVVLAPFVLAGHRSEFAAATRKDWIVITLIALAGMVGFTASLLFGMRLTTGVIGATVMSATPAVTAAAAVIFLGAAITWRKGAALALAVIGILTINLLRTPEGGSGGDAVLLGTALVVLAICFEAAYTLLSKGLSPAVSSLAATFAASAIAVPAFILLALIFDPRPFDYAGAGVKVWTSVAFWGAGTAGLAPVLWYNGVRRSPGVLAAGFMSVMPLTALVLSYILLGEQFRWAHVLGFGLVFTGLVLMIREHTPSGGECH